MIHRLISFLIPPVIGVAIASTSPAHAQDAQPPTATPAVAKPDEERAAAANAVAGMLIRIAATELLVGDPIQLKLEIIDMRTVSPRDRQVVGTGLLRIGEDPDWLPFRYRALYDAETRTASWARIALGSHDRGGEAVNMEEMTLVGLAEATGNRMRQEFPQQAVSLDLASARKFEAGRYQRYLAQGTAQFDGQASVEARVEGLYDPARRGWIRVSYELGDTAHRAMDDDMTHAVPR